MDTLASALDAPGAGATLLDGGLIDTFLERDWYLRHATDTTKFLGELN